MRAGIEYNYRTEDVAPPVENAAGTPFADLADATGTDPAGYMTEAPALSSFALSAHTPL